MRKILSGFLATSMIVAVASSVTFAATNPSVAFEVADGKATPTIEFVGTGADTVTAGKATLKSTATVTSVDFTLGGDVLSIPVNKTITKNIAVTGTGGTFTFKGPDDTGAANAAYIALSKSDVIALVDGVKFSSVKLDGKLYSGSITHAGGDKLVINLDGAKLSSNAGSVSVKYSVSYDYSGLEVVDNANPAVVVPIQRITASLAAVGVTNVATDPGTGTDLSEVETTGDFFNMGIKQVIWCDGNGIPVPMTEKGIGTDKDLNDQGGVQSGKTLYFMVNDTYEQTFADDTYWKLKITKGDNAKLIKGITDTTKIFSSGLVNANTGEPITGVTFGQRHRYIKVELNEIFTDDEYKITLDLRMSPTSKAVSKFSTRGVDGSEIKIKDFSFWLKNIVKPADNDWKVGIGGLMLNPLQNDWNEVTYYDEDGDLAFMKFFADSDVDKFYAKLSTKWEHADYASYFNDQDAYIFDFVGSPKISATSRCDLQIYNPFVDEDGNETIDPASAVIYQVIDGDLFDVTDSFKYEEGDNGDMAYITRTRFLGTYIICEKAVEEAVNDNADVPTDLVPEDTTPSEVTPDNNGGGKAPANTGKYL